ncbi:hypothetical protein OH492_14730 [Vibrio chagasii]|nr:hypothetical protein [Vibrio chagasii]
MESALRATTANISTKRYLARLVTRGINFPTFIVVIVIVAMVPEIRTIVDGDKPIKMSVIIQMMMLCFGGIILLATKLTRVMPYGVVFKSGMVAAIAIFGIAGCRILTSNTHASVQIGHRGNGKSTTPWTFALAPFTSYRLWLTRKQRHV